MYLSKRYSGINYDFQPTSYWSPDANPLGVALRNIKGRNRREMIQNFYNNGTLETLADELLAETLTEDARRSLGLIHPSFMEDLQNFTRVTSDFYPGLGVHYAETIVEWYYLQQSNGPVEVRDFPELE